MEEEGIVGAFRLANLPEYPCEIEDIDQYWMSPDEHYTITISQGLLSIFHFEGIAEDFVFKCKISNIGRITVGDNLRVYLGDSINPTLELNF